MARLICTWCLSWAVAVGVAPPSIVPPPVSHAAVPTGLAVSQTPSAKVGNAVATVVNTFSNTQIGPGSRGQPLMTPTDTKLFGSTLKGKSPMDAAIREEHSVRQHFLQDLPHAPKADAVESGNSLGAFVLAVVAGTLAGGLWWRRRALKMQRQDSAAEMTFSSSIVWSEKPTFAVAAIASERPFDPIDLADGGKDVKIKHGQHVLLEALLKCKGFVAVLNAPACRARMLRRAIDIDVAGFGASLVAEPAFGSTCGRALEKQQGRGAVVARAALGFTSCLGNSLDEVANSLAHAKFPAASDLGRGRSVRRVSPRLRLRAKRDLASDLDSDGKWNILDDGDPLGSFFSTPLWKDGGKDKKPDKASKEESVKPEEVPTVPQEVVAEIISNPDVQPEVLAELLNMTPTQRADVIEGITKIAFTLMDAGEITDASAHLKRVSKLSEVFSPSDPASGKPESESRKGEKETAENLLGMFREELTAQDFRRVFASGRFARFIGGF